MDWIPKAIALLLIVIKPGANCCPLLIKGREEKRPNTEEMLYSAESMFSLYFGLFNTCQRQPLGGHMLLLVHEKGSQSGNSPINQLSRLSFLCSVPQELRPCFLRRWRVCETCILCCHSAGVGRTGVFITLSIVLERMRYEGAVDIFQTVKMLRTQRPAMVQTEVKDFLFFRGILFLSGSIYLPAKSCVSAVSWMRKTANNP